MLPQGNPYSSYDLMNNSERAAFDARVANIMPYDPQVSTGWWDRTVAMGRATNTLQIIGNNSAINNAYEDPNYSPNRDPLVRSNDWISQMYPDVWSDLMSSKSSAYSASVIMNVKKSQFSKNKMAEGSFLGLLTGGLVAGLVDPINYILPVIGTYTKAGTVTGTVLSSLNTAKKARHISKLTMGERAFINGVENSAAAIMLEPFLRKEDITRTDKEAMVDIALAGLFGAGFGAGLEMIGKGYTAASEAASMRLIGEKSPQIAAEKHAGKIWEISNNTEEKKAYWDRVRQLDSLTELTQEEADIGSQYIDDAIAEVIPALGEVKGINKLLKVMFISPNTRLFGSKSSKVRSIAYNLIDSIFEIDGADGKASADSKIKLVDHVFGQRVREHADAIDTFVADHPDIDISSDQISELVAHLIRTGKDSIDEVSPDYLVNFLEDDGIVKRNPFQGIDDPQIKEIVKTVAADYRKIIKLIDTTSDRTGFLSSVLRDHDINGMDLASYVARWIDPNKYDQRIILDDGGQQVDLFVDSIVEGIRHSETKTKDTLKRDQAALMKEREGIYERMGRIGDDPQDPSRGRQFNKELDKKTMDKLSTQLENLEARIEAIEEALSSNNWSDESVRRLAMSIAHNYTAAYNEAAPNSRGGAGGAKEVLRRKVSIEDRFISPWLVNDTRATLEKAQMHLIPKMILADEIASRFLGHLNYNKVLGDLMDDLKAFDDDIRNREGMPTEEEAAHLQNLKDTIQDTIRESELVKEMLMITMRSTDSAFLKNPLNRNQNFDNLESAITFVHNVVKDRINTRKDLSETLKELKRVEREILYEVGDTQVDLLIKERTTRERNLADAEAVETPDSPYYSVLDDGYRPVMDDGTVLDLNNRVDDFDVEYTVDNRLALGARISVEGTSLPKKVRIVEVTEAVSDRAKDQAWRKPIKFGRQDTNGFIVVSKDGKWSWISPEDVARLKIKAFEKKLGELPSGDPRILKLKKKLRLAKKEGVEFRKKSGKSLGDVFEARKTVRIAEAEYKLDSVNKEIAERIQQGSENPMTKPLAELDRKHRSLWEKYHEKARLFKTQTNTLDNIAQQTSEIRRNVPHLSHASKKLDKAMDELSIFDGIGFEENFGYYEKYGWNPVSTLGILSGADEIDLRSGFSTFQGEIYQSSLIAQEARRRNTQFFLDPEFLMADVMRDHGSLNKSEIKSVRDDLEYIYAQLQNKTISPDVDPNWQKFSRAVKNLNYLRYMGMVTIASLGDFGNAVGTLGLGRYIKTLFTVFDNFRDRENLSAVASLVAAGEVAGPETRSTKMLGVDGGTAYIDPITGAPRSSAVNNSSLTSRFVEGFDRTFAQDTKLMRGFNMYGNFLSQFNAFNKRIVTLGLEDMVVEIAMKKARGQAITERDKGILEGLRFNDDDLDQIWRYWSSIDQASPERTRKKKIIGRDFYLSNSGHWNGSFAYKYEMKIRSAVNSIIVTPTIGDLPRAFQDPTFAPFLQFKSFLVAQTNKMFLPMIQRGLLYKDLNQVAMVLGVSAIGTLSYAIYETMAGNDVTKDTKYKDPKTGEEKTRSWVTKAVLEGLDRGGAFAMLFATSNIIERFGGTGIHSIFGGELNRRYRARTLGDTLLGPAGGLLTDLAKSGTGVMDLVYGRDVTESQLTAMRRLIPLQNLIWIKLATDVAPSAYFATKEPNQPFDNTYATKYFNAYSTGQGRLFNLLDGE